MVKLRFTVLGQCEKLHQDVRSVPSEDSSKRRAQDAAINSALLLGKRK